MIESPMMKIRLYGRYTPTNTCCPPLSHVGATTDVRSPKYTRAACIMTKLTPQVANIVSNGRPYRKRITVASSNNPNPAAERNATGSAVKKYDSNMVGGRKALKASCVINVA